MKNKLRQASNQYAFVDQPAQTKRADYKKAASEIARLVNVPEVISVYQTGSVKAPGLSDLDFVIITKDNMKGSKFASRWKTAQEKYPYLIQHDPFVINKSNASMLNKALPLFSFTKLCGVDQKFAKLDRPTAVIRMSDIIATSSIHPYLNTLIEHNFPSFTRYAPAPVKRAFARKNISVKTRHLLCRLSTFRYMNNLYKTYTGNSLAKSDKFQKKADKLRASWFSMYDHDRNEQLLQLTEDYLKLIIKSIASIDKSLSKYIQISGLDNTTCYLFPRILHFSADWNPKDALNIMLDNYERTQQVVAHLPLRFAAQLLMHPKSKSYFDKTADAEIKHKYEENLLATYEVGAKVARFLQDNKIPGTLMHRMDSLSSRSKMLRSIAMSTITH